jgi:asparagine synthase (glutamine-hydrolysing)
MCGITGFVGRHDELLLRDMCASLVHRGPDDDGFYHGDSAGLAMRRLSIIDLRGGKQPIPNESRTAWVVLNGEIYNYQELRERLLRRGHVMSTASDTETIIHLYEDYGLGFAAHLRGMFAIAIWDEARTRLVLARDPIGEKPLYYAADGPRLLFGSEIKAILRGLGSREVDPQSVCDFLALGYVPGAPTFFRGIQKLPPGHLLVHDGQQAVVSRYARPSVGRAASAPGFPAAKRELEERLSDTVRLCLKSDVEVGAFLSGGIDSSVLVALMRRHAARVQTFSVGFAGRARGFNELEPARHVASHLGTTHHELILGAAANIDLLPRITWHYDEPQAEPTSVLVYQLSEFTKRHVKVAVGGTGGDEIFFGYPRHRAVRLLEYYRRLPRFVRTQLVERVVARWPESTSGSRFAKRVRRFVRGAHQSPAEAYLGWVSLIQPAVRSTLLSDRVRHAADDPSGERFLRDYLTDEGGDDLLNQAAAIDVGGYLPEYQLVYMDRMTMAQGLELRSPLCDVELVSYVMSLPTSYRLRGLRSKHILKEVARAWVPQSIVDRPKVGFDSPIGQWIKDELRPFFQAFLGRDQVSRSGLIDGVQAERLLAEHLGGARDHSLQLWALLALESWYRMYIEDRVVDGAGYRLSDMRGTPAAIDRRTVSTPEALAMAAQ